MTFGTLFASGPVESGMHKPLSPLRSIRIHFPGAYSLHANISLCKTFDRAKRLKHIQKYWSHLSEVFDRCCPNMQLFEGIICEINVFLCHRE